MLGEEERGQGSPMGRGGGYDTGVGGSPEDQAVAAYREGGSGGIAEDVAMMSCHCHLEAPRLLPRRSVCRLKHPRSLMHGRQRRGVIAQRFLMRKEGSPLQPRLRKVRDDGLLRGCGR